MATALEHCIITNHKSIEYWQDSPYPPNTPAGTHTLPNTFLIVVQPNKNLSGPNGSTNGYWAVDSRDFSISEAPTDNDGIDISSFMNNLSGATGISSNANSIDVSGGSYLATNEAMGLGNEDNGEFVKLNLLYKSLSAANDIQQFSGDIDILDLSSNGNTVGSILALPGNNNWCVCCDINQNGINPQSFTVGGFNAANNIISGLEYCDQSGYQNSDTIFNLFEHLSTIQNINSRVDKVYHLGSSLNIPDNSMWFYNQIQSYAPATTWNTTTRQNMYEKWDPEVGYIGISNWFNPASFNTDAPPEDNVVLVWVRLKDNFSMPPEDHKIKIDINGDAKWVETNPQGMPAYSDGGFNLISSSSNSATETITATDNATITQEVLDGGFPINNYSYNPGERTVYKISGKFKKNEPTVVAKIKVEAGSGKFLPSFPRLNTYSKLRHLNIDSEDFIKLVLTNVEKTDSRKTLCEYNLIYNNLKDITHGDGLSANLNHKAVSIPTRTNCIGQISVGGTIIGDGGGAKLIKIPGIPGSTFAISVDENIYDLENESYSEDGTKARVRQRALDKSIIDSRISTSRVDEYGNTKNIIEGVIDSSGSYSFTQKFPSSIVKKTKLNGARDGVSSLVLDDVTGIKIGDRVIIRKTAGQAGIPDTNAVTTVSSITPDTKTIGVSSSVTAADNTGVAFKRRRTYSLSLIKDLSSTPCNNTITDFVFEQRLDPLLTLKVSTAGSAYKINGGGMGVDYTSTYLGKAYKKSDSLKTNRRHAQIYNITYSLTDATSNFATVTSPIFSANKNAVYDGSGNHIEGSHWSNSIPNENGGTVVNIQTISVSAVGSTSLTIKVQLGVYEWGSEDVTMELNLDKILTLT